MAKEDLKDIQKLLFYGVNNSNYTHTDLLNMDVFELFETIDLISSDIKEKNKAIERANKR